MRIKAWLRVFHWGLSHCWQLCCILTGIIIGVSCLRLADFDIIPCPIQKINFTATVIPLGIIQKVDSFSSFCPQHDWWWAWLLFFALFLAVCGLHGLLCSYFDRPNKVKTIWRDLLLYGFRLILLAAGVGLFVEAIIPLLNAFLGKNIQHWDFTVWTYIVFVVGGLGTLGAAVGQLENTARQTSEQVKQGERTQTQLDLTKEQLQNTERQLKLTGQQIELSRQTLAETQTNNLAKLFIDASKILEESKTASAYSAGLALMRVVYQGADGKFRNVVVDTIERLARGDTVKNNPEFESEFVYSLKRMLTYTYGSNIPAHRFIMLFVEYIIDMCSYAESIKFLGKLAIEVDRRVFYDTLFSDIKVILASGNDDRKGELLEKAIKIFLSAPQKVKYSETDWGCNRGNKTLYVEKAIILSHFYKELLKLLVFVGRRFDLREVSLTSSNYHKTDSIYPASGDCSETYLDYESLQPYINIGGLIYVKFEVKGFQFQGSSVSSYFDCKLQDCAIYACVKLCSDTKISGSATAPAELESQIYSLAWGGAINLRHIDCYAEDWADLGDAVYDTPEGCILFTNTMFKSKLSELFQSAEAKKKFEELYALNQKEDYMGLKLENCYYDSALITDKESRDWFAKYGIKPYPQI